MAKIVSTRIDIPKILAGVSDPASGGTVVFIGTVRNNHGGKEVEGLEYEAYTRMAEAKLKEIEGEAGRRWPIGQISIVHRKGRLRVGEVSVVVAVSAEHRAEAFEASRFAIEALKRTVPIWKRESTPEGKTGWVKGNPIERLKVTRRRRALGPG
ncbi:MAG: molybdenum cofactor biosynthesis protein MoaE [Nitrososphaerales archaeon]